MRLSPGPSSKATISGAIANGAATGGLVVSGVVNEDGRLVLLGANTYSGGTTVLSVSNNGALGSGGLTLDSGATLALTGSPSR